MVQADSNVVLGHTGKLQIALNERRRAVCNLESRRVPAINRLNSHRAYVTALRMRKLALGGSRCPPNSGPASGISTH